MPKLVYFGEFWQADDCCQTVIPDRSNFNKIKIDEKCQNWKILIRHFESFWNNVIWKNIDFPTFFHLVREKKFSSRILKFAKAQETITPLWHSCHRFKFQFTTDSAAVHNVWKLLKMSHFVFFNFGIFHQFLFN